ncbi:hypothetical protein BpHYR1_036117 [Brachionus plicatilis]|uniref:Uncharacterized protein n=1 Tax=Brachionus plicatilis TaxID=10195 RepID=A0A3M7S5T2_BRAPC|nr:hypothetical protein BpHYR1_036117 [Brachionus plicatilis]
MHDTSRLHEFQIERQIAKNLINVKQRINESKNNISKGFGKYLLFDLVSFRSNMKLRGSSSSCSSDPLANSKISLVNDSRPTTSKSVLDSPDEESVQKKPRTSADDILSEINFNYSLNTVISNCKIIRTPKQNSWGCLQFYENSKLVYAQDLWLNEYIQVNGENLLNLNESKPKLDDNSNFLMNYWDWAHVLDKGFSLIRKSDNTVQMKISETSDGSCQYKIFTGDAEIVPRKGQCEIYNGLDVIKKLEKDMVTSMPYWLLLKINSEFTLLDNKIKATTIMWVFKKKSFLNNKQSNLKYGLRLISLVKRKI